MADQDPILDQIKQRMALEASKGVPSTVRGAMGDAVLDSQRYVIGDPYYSAISFEPDTIVTAAGVTTYTFNKGDEVTAFGYAVGDTLANAGFSNVSGRFPVATLAETNIRDKGKPKAGQTALVYGLSFILYPDSDVELAKILFPNIAVVRMLDGGNQRAEVGKLDFTPGSGGLYGAGDTFVAPPDWEGIIRTTGVMSNGLPGRDNMLVFPEPWYWRPAGKEDSDLAVVSTLQRVTAIAATARAAGGAGVLPTAYTPPATKDTLGTYVRGMFVIHSMQKSKRSSNV